MYLYYYCNETYVGTVDIEVFMSMVPKKALITCTQEAEDLLNSLELMYGKRIERCTMQQAYDYSWGNGVINSEYRRLPPHVFTTKKMGKQLQWSEWDGTLCG